MAQPQQQPNYKYTPSSARSTRQILESTNNNTPQPTSSVLPATATTDPTNMTFRPQIFKRTSHNYAEADRSARSSIAEAGQGAMAQVKGQDDERQVSDKTGTSPTSVGWKPNFARKQSWNPQDKKRELQMNAVVGKDSSQDSLPGFSEKGADYERYDEGRI